MLDSIVKLVDVMPRAVIVDLLDQVVSIPIYWCMLQNCKSMVIYKVIDIEELKCLKRSMHCNQVINKIGILGCKHKMDGSIDTIDMNNCNVRLSSVSIDIWL